MRGKDRRAKIADMSQPRPPIRMARVLRPGQVDDGAFDREFWDRVGHEGRFAAAWDLVNEVHAFRGTNAQPRLSRSVLRIVRR
jgi:hypothetical protein